MARATQKGTTHNAGTAYAARTRRIHELMTSIGEGLDRHHRDFESTDRRHWGYVGDLAEIVEQLERIDATLRNDDTATR